MQLATGHCLYYWCYISSPCSDFSAISCKVTSMYFILCCRLFIGPHCRGLLKFLMCLIHTQRSRDARKVKWAQSLLSCHIWSNSIHQLVLLLNLAHHTRVHLLAIWLLSCPLTYFKWGWHTFTPIPNVWLCLHSTLNTLPSFSLFLGVDRFFSLGLREKMLPCFILYI